MKFRNGILACLLASFAALAGVASAVAGAQTGDAPAGKSPAYGGFVIYQNENGDTVCRSADAAQLRRLAEGRADGMTLIYAGAPKMRAPSGKIVNSPFLLETASGTPQLALAPSAGLHIFLRATTQLNGNQTAKNAFIAAANRWEARISTPINVVIDVDYGTTIFNDPFPGSDVLGATTSRELISKLGDVRQRLLDNSPTAAEQAVYGALPTGFVGTEFGNSTFRSTTVRMTLANARALGLAPDVDSGSTSTVPFDARIGFNSAFGFDFNPDDGITSNQTDFDAVATHEIGHALGFSSQSGGATYASVSMWDLFRFRPGAANVGTFGTAPRVMSAGGSQVYFNGRTNTFGTQELGLSTGGPEGAVGDGNQSSHWKDSLSGSGGSYIGIMDPAISKGVRQQQTENDFSAIDSFGYSLLGNNVGHPAPPPPPPTGPPSNDNFANATTLAGSSGTATGDSTGATKQAGEPALDFSAGGRSVWFNWTAPASGTATIDTEGSAFDTMLGVYTGGGVNSLTQITSNDDIDTENGFINSKVTFAATAGQTYRVVVDGYVNNAAQGADFGYIQLNWQGQAAQVASSIQFSSAGFTASEGAGSGAITLTRTGDLTTTQSVSIFTADSSGTATVGADYDPIVLPVVFNPGEAGKTVHVGVRDDAQTEPTETVVLQLSNPSAGVTLGSPSTATLSITDDDFGPVNSVQFASAGTTVSEGAGRVTVTVTRSGSDVTHPATVFYRTVNGTASERTDFTGAAGRLRFAAGETSKSFAVLLTNDRFSEGAEVFNVTLSDASGASVGTPSTFAVNVTDDDSATTASPVRWDSNFDAAFFVRQHYIDFLGREADDAGLAFWTDQMTNCGTPNLEICRVNVSGSFFQAIEFQETGYLSYRTYKAAYGDAQGTYRDANGVQNAILVPVIRLEEFLADTRRIGEGVVVGQGAWQAQLEANKVAYFEEFVASQRFANRFGTAVTPSDFVDSLYFNAGVVPTPERKQAAVAEFGGALNTAERAARARALRRVAEDPALNQLERNRAFVTMQFFGYLRRNPNDPQDTDHTGWKFWLDKLNAANGNFVAAEMVKAFITADEYRFRFGN